MTVSSVDTPSRLEQLLRDFKRIAGPSSTPATFLETAGYPHFENVASNLLAFFLDPDEDHGLGSLFLDALLAPLPIERLTVHSIEREAGTANGNRIDLLIDCESHVIGVENKIYAPVYNPLDDYWAHLQQVAGDRRAILLLLGLHEPPPGSLPADVVAVTYDQLMARVRQNLGTYATDTPAQYLTFALDFVKTMENLRKGNRMNPAVVDLFIEKDDEVIELLHAARDFSKELRSVVERTGEIVTPNLPTYHPQKVHKWFYKEERNLLQVLVHDVEFPSSAKVAIDAALSTGGWDVFVWQRRGNKLPSVELLRWLERGGVPFLDGNNRESISEGQRVVTAHFPFRAPLEDVAAHVLGVVKAVARAPFAPGESDA